MAVKKRNKRITVKEVLTGRILESEWFLNNRILLFVIFIMLITNITVRYKSEKVIRNMQALEDSLIDLRSKSISIAADVMRLSRQSMIIDRVKKSGIELETSKEPPHKIYVDKE
jgi:cell division protein FtsL